MNKEEAVAAMIKEVMTKVVMIKEVMIRAMTSSTKGTTPTNIPKRKGKKRKKICTTG